MANTDVAHEAEVAAVSAPSAPPRRQKVSKRATQSAQIGDYVYFTPAIGKGSYSRVFAGYHVKDAGLKTPTWLAIKRVSLAHMKKMSMKRIQREIDLLKSLDHPNIVRFHEAFTDIAQNVYIVTEFANHGSLDRFTKDTLLGHEDINDWMTQLRDGLHFLLRHNILHRDLKPQNILLHKEPISGRITLKIADFGFAKAFESLSEDSMMETLCGTPMYLSPEVVKTRKYAIPSDLWSVGVMMYQLFYHTMPFERPRNILELMKSLDTMTLRFPADPKVDAGAKELMTTLLQTDPLKRSSWGNFFTHSWFATAPPADEPLLESAAVAPDSPVAETQEQEDLAADRPPEEIAAKKPGAEPESVATLEDSGFGAQIKRLLDPEPPVPDELEVKGYVSRLYQVPFLVEDYLAFTPGPSSVPIEGKLKGRFGQPLMNLSAATNSISPLMLPRARGGYSPDIPALDNVPARPGASQPMTIVAHRRGQCPSPLAHIPELARDYERGGMGAGTAPMRTGSESPDMKGMVPGSGSPWSQGLQRTWSWLGSTSSTSWARSGEEVARAVGEVMSGSLSYLGSTLSPLWGKGKEGDKV